MAEAYLFIYVFILDCFSRDPSPLNVSSEVPSVSLGKNRLSPFGALC